MISSGRARDTFREVVRLQSGDARVVDEPERLPRARHTVAVTSPRAGFVTGIRCEQVGVAGMLLGGGREKKEDPVDPAVGIVLEKKTGDAVEAGATLCTLHYNSEARLEEARELVEESFRIGPAKPAPAPLVRRVIGAEKE
jgi:thymidine phosphorylase